MPRFFVAYFNAATSLYEAINSGDADKSFTADTGLIANGLAALRANKSGKFVAFPVDGAGKAFLETNLGNANDDLKFTAVTPGPGGNSIRIRYVVAGANTSLSVSVSSLDITVNVATNGSSVATSTATQVKAALDASGPATALITTALKASNTGAGVVSAFGYTNLANGDYGVATATITTVAPAADSSVTTF